MKLLTLFNEILNENWYHGTYSAEDIEKKGSFTKQTINVDYMEDPYAFIELQQNMKNARENGNEDLYFQLLHKVPNLRKSFSYDKPLFLTNKYSVAKTYADPKRALDYQNAMEKVYEVDVDCNKIVKIIATGDRFRFINADSVKNGFINAGVTEKEIDKIILMFNYYVPDNKGIKTNVIAAIGNWLNFDCIDVIGVLDSYHGGNIKSTVRMVLNPTKTKIKKL